MVFKCSVPKGTPFPGFNAKTSSGKDGGTFTISSRPLVVKYLYFIDCIIAAEQKTLILSIS